jgi:lysylphosphatidylglycerol synthetase-like protein (DUF2156 family)
MSTFNVVLLIYVLPVLVLTLILRYGVRRKKVDAEWGNVLLAICPVVNLVLLILAIVLTLVGSLYIIINGRQP